MTATFRRKLTTTTDILGADIKDSPVSALYKDVFSGNSDIFATAEGLQSGQLPMGNYSHSVDYLIEFPILNTPSFGEATLSGLELNLYFSGLNYKRDYFSNTLKIFKLKEEIGTNADGFFGSLQTADIFFASAIPNKVLLEMEDFSTPGLGTSPTLVPVGALFVNAEIAYANFSSPEKMFADKEEFLEKYAEDYMNEQVVYLEYYSAAWNWRTYSEPALNFLTSAGNFLFHEQRSREKHSYQLLRPVNRTWLGFDPTWYTSELKGALRTTGGYMEISADMSMNEGERLGLVSTDNSFFDEVRYSPSHMMGVTATGSFAIMAYSYAQVDADGLHLHSKWLEGLSVADGSPINFGSTTAPYQSIMLRKSLPHPSWLIRERGSSSTHKEALEIDIIFKINELPVMERITDHDDVVPGSWTTLAREDGITLATRGFFITLGTNAPQSSEDFAKYLGNAYDRDSSNRKVTSTGAAFVKTNNNWVFGIVSYGNEKPTGTNDGLGRIGILTSGDPSNNKNYIAAMSQSGAGGSSTAGAPYIYTAYAQQFTPVGSTKHSLYGNGSHEINNTFAFGAWVKLKIVISNEYPRVGYILTDSEDNIIWSRKDLRMGRASGSLEEDCKNNGFPRYLCLWLNNRKIHFDTSEADNGYYSTSAHTAAASVSVKSIDISNVTCEVFNGTNAINNEPYKRAPEINAETERSLIQADDLNTATTTSQGNFGGAMNFMQNIYDMFGLESGGLQGVTPSYLIFGTTNKEDWEDQDTNLFLGGYSTDNSAASDGGETVKRMQVIKSNAADSDVFMYPGTERPYLGQWTGHIYADNINKATSGFRMRDNTSGAAMQVDYFTQKGFVRFEKGSLDIGTWTKRECPFLAAKIIKINNARTGKVTVADMSGLLGKPDEEYIIYRIGRSWNNSHYAKGLKLANSWKGTATLKFNSDLRTADDNSTPLLAGQYLDELYISPYRYWLIMEMYNIAASGNATLPAFNYEHTLLLDDVTSPPNTTKGATYSELLYSDAPYNQNAWSLMISKNSSIETEKDYGFGSIEDEGEGYLAKEKISKDADFTRFDISGLVEEIDKNKRDDKITVYITKDITSQGSSKLSSTRVSSSSKKPYLTFVYTDELPSIQDFKVQPNEDDPFYAQYTWSSNNDDLWYGFVILDEESIEHQYHSAVAHIPLNERSIATDGSKTNLYRYNGSYNGAATAAAEGDHLTNTIEGLAGYALDFNGEDERFVSWNEEDYTEPTSNASFVAHVVVDSTSGDSRRAIVSKRNQVEIYLDSGGKVNAKLYYIQSFSVNLQSSSVVPEDGETPTNIIVTLDASLAVGNCKLFINGKLEDQSGVKTTDGSTHNWKTGAILNTTSANLAGPYSMPLVIGAERTGISFVGYAYEFHGHIEEVVIYNKTIYPVVPQTGELTIYKQPVELTVADIAAGKSIVAKLFIKDYHNIRGTTTNEVASTSMVAYRKSGVGLKTN